MKTKIITLSLVVCLTAFLSSWGRGEETNSNANRTSNRTPKEIISAKLDTLEATVNAMKKGNLGNKFYEVEYTHLRLVMELKYYLDGITLAGKDKYGRQHITSNSGDDLNDRFNRATGGYGGGSPYNRNWISHDFPYMESKDYEYPDAVYPFNESITLPTFGSN